MEKKYLIYGGIGCAVLFVGSLLLCLFLLIACNSCGDDRNNGVGHSEEYLMDEDSDTAPGWIQGTWYCATPYGNFQVEISGDHIREITGGEVFDGKYHIQGDYIMTETGSHQYYQMDRSSQRLMAGHGYYFEKQ